MGFYGRWAPYVSVAKRRANAAREANKLAKKGQELRPIRISSRAIANSFWGIAWCNNLEIYADWANRMPRGRTYARNGSIVDLQIRSGEISSIVSGSSLYKIKISIDKLEMKKWKAIRTDCAQQVGSLLDLMRGKLPEAVLKRLTDPKTGMFPGPKELKVSCSCPDYATVCKHVAATLYGVGHLLDSDPDLFFKMRGVDQSELVNDAITTQTTSDTIGLDQQSDLAGEDLGTIFGIDLAVPEDAPSTVSKKTKSATRVRKRTTAAVQKTLTVATSKPSRKIPTAKKSSQKVKTASRVQTRTSTTSKRARVALPEKGATKRKLKVIAKPAKKTTRKVVQSVAVRKANPLATSTQKKRGSKAILPVSV